MTFGVEECKELIKSKGSGIIPEEISKLCVCFDTTITEREQECDCDELTNNKELSAAILSFQRCSGYNMEIDSRMPGTLDFLTKPCYAESLKQILSSIKSDVICKVNITLYKEQGQKIATMLGAIGGTFSGALGYVDMFKNMFSSSTDFFSEILDRFTGYSIMIPIGILIFILIVVIGIFYSVSINSLNKY
ncbi:hypothetical protein POVWA2_079980 [Plasmodium ovale wallikeri]|uniref:Uncharacterized protein n=1 Tax=Plasmodium ovale wallikeri TaxID=864142 RepID=A0A1A9ALI0_PLAOA|nr:hypothetical protein POVWA1_081890 [Plasmodium ovale wallikeri]SBT57491.1 hypothetical protein POVWA2_079980 [Plasmodium ovale wallikeri]